MAPPPPHKVTARDFGTGTILVQVGPSETRENFVIHHRLLESASEYFRALFESFFIEKSNEKLELFHNDPKVFSTFVDWLYSGQVDEGPVSMKDDTCEDTFRLRLYVMADYFQCENLHREAMNRLQKLLATRGPASFPACSSLLNSAAPIYLKSASSRSMLSGIA